MDERPGFLIFLVSHLQGGGHRYKKNTDFTSMDFLFCRGGKTKCCQRNSLFFSG